MKIKVLCILSVFILFSSVIFAEEGIKDLARQAVSEDKTKSMSAITTLRQMNQKGLDLLFEVYSEEIKNYVKTGGQTTSWQRIVKAIDSVAMQKDAYSSRLFWYTDLEKAKTAAKTSNKPILTLRLLGNLNEEYSCANSRFFRSILYSNKKISNHLRDNYILHWKSVRPAPKITIDFGNGRKLVRTITGNSIHYILDKNGKILDALPGLYNPTNFLKYLVNISALNQNPRMRKNYWSRYRSIRRSQLLGKWQRDLVKIGNDKTPASRLNTALSASAKKNPLPKKSRKNKNSKTPTALKAVRLAVTKSAVEMPTVRSIAYNVGSLKKTTTFEEWKKLAHLFGKVKIDESSKNFIIRKSRSKNASDQNEMSSLISNLEKYVSIDTVQNEYVFHTKIYKWLNEGFYLDVEMFNERVYTELFLTPKSDKWLGLYSPDIYSAIENNGVVK